MFAQARWRASNLRQVSRRLQSTLAEAEAGASTSSSPTPPEAAQTTQVRRERRRKDSRGTIFVRPWDGVGSMPEALAIVRGIERKYGKIRDFRLLRDPENPMIYQSYFWVQFHNAESINAVPEESSVLQVNVPIVNKAQPGGIGLKDLQGLLDAGDKVKDESSQYQSVASRMKDEKAKEDETWRLVDVRIERTVKPIYYQVAQEYPGRWRRYVLGAGEAFSKWGGFYVPKEAPSQPIPEADLAVELSSTKFSPLAGIRMRRAQTKWSRELAQAQELRDSRKEASGEPRTNIAAVEAEAREDLIATAQTTAVLDELAESEQSQAPPEVPTEAEAAESSQPESSSPEQPKQLSQSLTRRQRLLAQARENARTPLPENLVPPTPEELAAKAEAEKKAKEESEKEALSMKDRLWKLMGGRWL